MPLFYSYVCFGVANDLLLALVQQRYASQFLRAFVIQACIDAALQYVILVELAWCVLRPVRGSLPRGTLTGLSLLVLSVGAACWPFCGHSSFPQPWQFLATLQQCTAILRILFFLVLAVGSQVLALGWRDRELQVATGLGSYSLVSLAAILVHSHQTLGHSYHWVDVVVAFSYCGALIYWIVSFSHAEAPRREFTPKMREVLISVAAVARMNRAG